MFLEVWSLWCSTDGCRESVPGVGDGYCRVLVELSCA